MYVSSHEASPTGVAGAMRWKFYRTKQDGSQDVGYLYMGFYDLNFQPYQMFIGVSKEKMSAKEGGYNTMSRDTALHYHQLGFTLTAARTDRDSELAELGLSYKDLKAKSFMVFTIKDQEIY